MTKTQQFRELHVSKEILHIGNVWDLNNALIFEKQGYKAIGTSSFAIAKSLGYEDGEEMSFEELYKIVKQIISKVNVPLSVDIEAGYSRDINKIIENIISLYDIGVVGINIEDSVVENGIREIVDKDRFAQILKEIVDSLKEKNIDIFINVRTDNFIMGLENPLENTLERIKLYEDIGVDGIFVPCIVNIEDIKTITQNINLPLNVMTMPDLDSFDVLENAGVKRVSQGPFIYNKLIENFENKLETITKDNSFQSLF
ncbi:carboxyvinyl-carboxyphosphonate phosphorylmutase [Halarcobacter mediterraneus]|uniref:Carboxyvinyl-carboxyphosphonate phosphorylmutase n=1 Tax=Halarcobacter mediterraneus TaxID=2023153 RepID=A0A4Q1AZ80_9BACT|nr:isocitrate lyase/phosphoenolpyruvate mutase family protein [Halarcobacter mediterraneus]RXK13079.1 carboxyvinyl-carboxyphosphonate phosphorylmutase [Halarcobacter mediterraneus]